MVADLVKDGAPPKAVLGLALVCLRVPERRTGPAPTTSNLPTWASPTNSQYFTLFHELECQYEAGVIGVVVEIERQFTDSRDPVVFKSAAKTDWDRRRSWQQSP